MKNPKVSIVVPAHNAHATISKTLHSLVKQTYQDFEIIIIDDGSTDDSAKIIKRWVKKDAEKFKYFWQINQGPAAARNKGLKEAKGEFVAWIDADDLWLPERLELMLKEFNKEPKPDFVSTDARYLYPDNKISKQTYYQINDLPLEYSFKELLKTNFIFGSPLIKKEVIEKIGFLDENLVRSEDYDYWLRILAKNYKLAIIKEPLALYRFLIDSRSQSFILVNQADLKVLSKANKLKKLSLEEKEVLSWHIKKTYLNLAQEYAKKREFGKAIKYFRRVNNAWSKLSIFLLSFSIGIFFWNKLVSLKIIIKKIIKKK